MKQAAVVSMSDYEQQWQAKRCELQVQGFGWNQLSYRRPPPPRFPRLHALNEEFGKPLGVGLIAIVGTAALFFALRPVCVGLVEAAKNAF